MDKIKPIEIYPRPGCCGAYPPAPPVKYVDYNTMVTNKPMINGHILEGNKTAKELGIDGGGDMSDYYTKQEVNALIPDMRNYYTKQQVDAKIPDMTNYYTKAQTDSKIADKQDTLVSGSNIKTINGESLLGSGNIDIQGGGDDVFEITYGQTTFAEIDEALQAKKTFIFKYPVPPYNVYTYIPQKVYRKEGDGKIEVHMAPGIGTVAAATSMQIFIWTVDANDTWSVKTEQTYTKNGADEKLALKQNKLTAESGIMIENNRISGTSLDSIKGATNLLKVNGVNGDKVSFEFGDDVTLRASSPMLFGEERTLQEKLVSGTNIKSVNGQTLLGSGNLIIGDNLFITRIDITDISDLNDAYYAGKVCVFADDQLSIINGFIYAVNGAYVRGYIGNNLVSYSVTGTEWTRLEYDSIITTLQLIEEITFVLNQIQDNGRGTFWATKDGTGFEKLEAEFNANKLCLADIDIGQIGIITDIDSTTQKVGFITTFDGSGKLWYQKYIIRPDNSWVSDSGYSFATSNDLTEVRDLANNAFKALDFTTTFNITIPEITSNVANTSIPKISVNLDTIDPTGTLGQNYAVMGLTKYEVFDANSGGNRLNVMPVCTFSESGQKVLSVRFMCAGTASQNAKRLQGTILLKHR